MELRIGQKVKIDRNSSWYRDLGEGWYIRGKLRSRKGTGHKGRIAPGGIEVSPDVAYRILKLNIGGDEVLLSCQVPVPTHALILCDQRAARKRSRREWLEEQPLRVRAVPGWAGGE